MPKIDISKSDLESLLGMDIKESELERFFFCAKGEVDGFENDTIKLDVKDSNRPDLWSVEGVVRELKHDMGIKPREYTFEKSDYIVKVNPNVKDIRPKVAYAVARNVRISDALLTSLIQMQEKIALSYGRKRKEVGIGLFDLNKIHGTNLNYFAADPKITKFAPLGYDIEMTLEQILQEHPKGKEYAHLLKGFNKYPILADEKNLILTMPPIINSNYSGKVTSETTDLFIEAAGLNQEMVNVALLIVCMALIDRGAEIETVNIDYGVEKIDTPYLKKEKMDINKQKIFDYVGQEVNDNDLESLLTRKGYDVKINKDKVELEYPNYRIDIMHPVDVIEDLLISMDYNKIKPQEVDVYSKGSVLEKTNWADALRIIGIGAGLQEIITFTLTSKEKQFLKMNRTGKALTIANPMSESVEIFRDSIIPEQIEFLSKNQHISYPQNVFEVGKVLEENDAGIFERVFFTASLCYEGVDYTYTKRLCDFVLNNIGAEKITYSELKHNSFIEGRVAKVSYTINGKIRNGIVGEIHPKVLNNFKLEVPLAVFELDVTSE